MCTKPRCSGRTRYVPAGTPRVYSGTKPSLVVWVILGIPGYPQSIPVVLSLVVYVKRGMYPGTLRAYPLPDLFFLVILGVPPRVPLECARVRSLVVGSCLGMHPRVPLKYTRVPSVVVWVEIG